MAFISCDDKDASGGSRNLNEEAQGAGGWWTRVGISFCGNGVYCKPCMEHYCQVAANWSLWVGLLECLFDVWKGTFILSGSCFIQQQS